MKCHICDNELTYIYRPTKISRLGRMECRSPECPRKSIINRCSLLYQDEKVVDYSFWCFEEKVWYQLNNNSYIFTATKYKVEMVGIGKYGNTRYNLRADPTQILEIDNFRINININDNLSEEINKLLKRIKTIVIFS